MQTIPIGARVMVLHRHRGERVDDNEYWTGTVIDDSDKGTKQSLLICFGEDNEENKWWYPASTVSVVD